VYSRRADETVLNRRANERTLRADYLAEAGQKRQGEREEVVFAFRPRRKVGPADAEDAANLIV
jgi:hypothetical protein